MTLKRMDAKWRVLVGFRGKISVAALCSAKVLAEAEAKRLRVEYPDDHAEFWVTTSEPRSSVRWDWLKDQLSRSGNKRTIFEESPQEVVEQRVHGMVCRAIRDEIAERRVDPALASLPYTVKELMAHIAKQFLPGMSWANWGSEWHIDHIHPRAAFDMREPAQLLRCWSLDNLQPLWAADNIAKAKEDRKLARAA